MRFIIASLLCLSGLPIFASPLRVLIDPGHGGKDHGTVHHGISESAITLSVSQRLYELLKQDERFFPALTRTKDAQVSLSDRAQMAKDLQADVFLSIHVNSSPDRQAKGAEFYFQNQLAPDQESMFLAHRENDLESGDDKTPKTYDFLIEHRYGPEVSAIVTDLLDGDRIWRSSRLSKSLKLSWRGTHKKSSNSVRQAPFYVLSQVQIPSALVELGFLSNTHDYRMLVSESAQNKMAQDLYRGLIRYQESITNGHASRQP